MHAASEQAVVMLAWWGAHQQTPSLCIISFLRCEPFQQAGGLFIVPKLRASHRGALQCTSSRVEALHVQMPGHNATRRQAQQMFNPLKEA